MGNGQGRHFAMLLHGVVAVAMIGAGTYLGAAGTLEGETVAAIFGTASTLVARAGMTSPEPPDDHKQHRRRAGGP